MTPTTMATVAAVVATLLFACIPVDAEADRAARSWVGDRWLRYRVKLGAIQLAATLIVAFLGERIGWFPAADADAVTAVATGISWSIGAVAVLRADVSGFRVSSATVGFSILRSFNGHFNAVLEAGKEEAIRDHLDGLDLSELKMTGFDAVARMENLQPDGTPTPAQTAYVASIDDYRPGGADEALCRQLVTTVIVKHNLTRRP